MAGGSTFTEQLLHFGQGIPPNSLIFCLKFWYTLNMLSYISLFVLQSNTICLITLLLKLVRIDEIGCNIEIGGTALLSFLYHMSSKVTSIPMAARSSLKVQNRLKLFTVYSKQIPTESVAVLRRGCTSESDGSHISDQEIPQSWDPC